MRLGARLRAGAAPCTLEECRFRAGRRGRDGIWCYRQHFRVLFVHLATELPAMEVYANDDVLLTTVLM